MKRTLKISQLAPIDFNSIILLTLLTNTLSQMRQRDLVNSFSKVDYSQRIRQRVVQLERALRDAESNQRAYLFSSETQYLDNYAEASEEIEATLAELEWFRTCSSKLPASK